MGGFDTGLGDDSDLSMMLIKQRFKLAYSHDAVVWTTVPETRHHLWNQRMRWRRNLIKIRISKQTDSGCGTQVPNELQIGGEFWNAQAEVPRQSSLRGGYSSGATSAIR
jgi:cellulose synthase/poly-beta-1,6-N-acetylglucosamine synthase-like glycosyltransferase